MWSSRIFIPFKTGEVMLGWVRSINVNISSLSTQANLLYLLKSVVYCVICNIQTKFA